MVLVGRRRFDLLGPSTANIKFIYYLYLAEMFAVGVGFAYLHRGRCDDWLDSHYRYQVWSVWMVVLFIFITLPLVSFSIIPLFPLLIVLAVWSTIGCIGGLWLIGKRQPIPNGALWI